MVLTQNHRIIKSVSIRQSKDDDFLSLHLIFLSQTSDTFLSGKQKCIWPTDIKVVNKFHLVDRILHLYQTLHRIINNSFYQLVVLYYIFCGLLAIFYLKFKLSCKFLNICMYILSFGAYSAYVTQNIG